MEEELSTKMIDDLQTLCAAVLRRHCHYSARVDDETDNGKGSSSSSSSCCCSNCNPPLMMDGRIFEALSECVTMSDKPLLIIEAARSLVDAFDTGLTSEQREAVDFGAIVDLRGSHDAAVRKEAGAVIGDIVNSTSEALRSSILEPLVRGVQGDEFSDKLFSAERLHRLVSLDDDPPIQRVIDSGVVPRLVEFLRPDEDPALQLEAMRALMYIASGTAEQAGVVFRAGAICRYVRLLQSPEEDVTTDAACSLGCIASESTTSRDFILRNHALPPLLALADRTSSPCLIQSAAWTIANLCCWRPPPPFALVRPALPTLARLLFNSDPLVVRDSCKAFGALTEGPNEQIREVVAAGVGVCRRLVELLRHPSSEVQMYVHCRKPPN
jgi:Armadillo/beta-catenin-like repeat